MNQSQEKAVLKTEGPCVILAGAGTGKTYTIVEKVKYILKNKLYPAEKIVCLTFSNEAANSLRKKILPYTHHKNQEGKEPIIKTFHSFCSDLLKKHGEKIGIKRFNILLPDDAKIILHKNFKVNPYYCNIYVSEIGIAKDLGISINELEHYLKLKTSASNEELEKNLEETKFLLHTLPNNNSQENYKQKKDLKEKSENLDKLLNISKLLQAWKSYEKIKEKKSFLDYSDLNKLALILLNKHPKIAEEFDYIIVDEFQDTNKLQCDLLEFICPRKNITVVGDMNQSIYRFRGAYKDNLDNFKKTFSVTEKDVFTLDISFRSTNKILEIAHSLIQNNYKNKEDCFKVLSAKNTEGENIEIFELENNKEEARKIIEIIKSSIQGGIPEGEICVLFRTHQQSKILKNLLDYENIQYTSITKKPLLKIGLIKIIRAYLTILSSISQKNSNPHRAWWDLVHNSDFNKKDEISIGNFIKQNREEPLLSIKFLNTPEIELTEKGKIQLKTIIKNIKTLIPEKESSITNIINKIYEILQYPETENKEKVLVLQKFYELAKEHEEMESESLHDFIHHLNIIDSLGIEIEAPSLNNSGIRIMTSHATKGLEYDIVIISNLAQKKFPLENNLSRGIIPSELSPELSSLLKNLSEKDKKHFIKEHEQENQLLEERRLCYVSFTRARAKLYLTYAKKYGSRFFYPSKFLQEINYKENKNIEFKKDSQLLYKEPELKIPQEITVSREKTKFSPSALQMFDECEKKYEYRYVYNMPEPTPISWDAIKLGSFVHKVLEEGVKANLKEEKQFLDLAKILNSEEKWQFVEISDALPLIKIFFHRNKNKYNENSLTECYLKANLSGLDFRGYADRIDIINKNKDLEIIDYKTGRTYIKPKYRNWQLGFYALAAKSSGVGNPRRLTLETLQHETPITFDLDENGNAKEIHSKMTFFNLNEVKEEIMETAKKILEAKKSGFKPCPVEKNCPFCEEWIY
ncbi:MAG: ATP-dependent DNA helicase [Candidatus Pacearchaeota archaeon]|nr:ATP-dependent DNA helicase [Candidatus Pacearchaeota archaeon]